MFEKQNGRKLLRCLVLSLLVCLLALTSVVLAKYAFDFSLPSFTINIKPAEKIELSSNTAQSIASAASDSGKGQLRRVVFGYWDMETGYTETSNDVTITDWNEAGSVALDANGGIRMFVRTNKDNAAHITVYVLSPSKMYAPKNSTSFFSYYKVSAFLNVREIVFTNFHMTDVTNCNSIFYGNKYLYNSSLAAFADKLADSKVTNLGIAFYGCSNMNTTTFNKIISALDGKQVTTFGQTFAGCNGLSGNLDLSTVNMLNVTTLYGMFNACEQITGLTFPATTNKLTNMSSMVSGCTNLTKIDISLMDTTKVTNMGDDYSKGTFENCSALTTIWIGDKWSTASVKTSKNMFRNCTSLIGEKGTAFSSSHTNAEYARRDGGPDSEAPGYLTHINAFSNQIAYLHSEQFDDYYADLLERFESEYPTEYAEMMVEVNALLALEGMEISTDDGYPYLYGKFYLEDLWRIWKSHLEKVYTDILMPTPAGIYADRQKSSVEKVTFVKLSEFTSPAHSPFDLPLDDYGSGAVRLSLEEGWLISEPNTLYFVVNDRYFDTMIAPENMSGFFQGFTNLTEVHFNGLLDVSGVTDFSSMFAGCDKLEAIYVAAGEDWSTISATDTGMFDGCTSLTGGSGTAYDSEQTGLAYARIDGGTENPGYFTQK